MNRPASGCGFISIGDLHSANGKDFIKASSGAADDLLIGTYFGSGGNTNGTGEMLNVLFPGNESSATFDTTSIVKWDDDTIAHLTKVQTFATGTKTITGLFDFGGGRIELLQGTAFPGSPTTGESIIITDTRLPVRATAPLARRSRCASGTGPHGLAPH